MSVRIFSWNVNGIRAILKKNFLSVIEEQNPDIICLQETKANQDQVNLKLDGYEQFWNSAEKKGYSGTLILTRIKPMNVTYGLGIEKHDNEGRVITLEFAKFFLVTTYTPNSKEQLKRLEYRTKEWDVDYLKFLKDLELKKPVIFCGDLNVAHKEIDLANPASNKKSPGFTKEERKSFDNIVENDFVDTFRLFCNEPKKYTWWSYRQRARDRNVGWRIDYFCASKSIVPQIKNSLILDQVLGSDHCPVMLLLDPKIL